MVRCAPLLVSISRSVGRRFAGAMTLALACSLSLGGVAIAAPPPPPPATTAAPTATAAAPADPKAAKQAWKAAKKAEKQAKKAAKQAKKRAKKAAKKGKQGAPSGTGAATGATATTSSAGSTTPPATTPPATGTTTPPTVATTPPPTVATTTPPPAETTTPPPVAAVPEPPAASEGLTALLPLQVDGSLSKDSRSKLGDRLQASVAATKVAGGPYRARLQLRVSKKKGYGLTLTVLEADDKTLATYTDACKGCSLEQVGARIDALVQQAAASLAPKEPPPPSTTEVSVRTEPLGARVRVDGVEQGFTPQVLELLPGEHTVAVDKPGFVAQEQKLIVEAGVPQAVDVALTAEPPAKGSKRSRGTKAPKEPTGPVDPGAGRGLKIGGLVMLGLGVAGVATGVAMILIDEEPKPLSCSGADVDFRGVCRYRYDTLVGGIVGVAAGGLGIGGGIAMMVKGRQVSLRGRAGKQQASLALEVRF